MPDTRKLYSLTFPEDPVGPREIVVRLPDGALKKMSFYRLAELAGEKDKAKKEAIEAADDFPYAEVLLDDEMAAEAKVQYANHGLVLTHIKKPKKPAEETLSEPEPAEAVAAGGTPPVALPAEPEPAPKKKRGKKE